MVPTNTDLLLNNNTIKGVGEKKTPYQQPLSTLYSPSRTSPAHPSDTDMNTLASPPMINPNRPPSVGSTPMNTCGLATTTTSTSPIDSNDLRPGMAQISNNNTNINSSSPEVKSCAGCKGRICDRFLLYAIDRYWHTGCLKCTCCHAQLGEIGQTCFAKGDMILCRNDYIRMFGCSGTCSACSQSIPASEFVMKVQGNVYHLACFACVTCHNRLVPGDRYSIVNGNVICEHDYPKVVKGLTTIPTPRHTSHKVC